MSQMVVEQAAKDTELQYFGDLAKSLQTYTQEETKNESKRTNKWLPNADEIAKKRLQQQEMIAKEEQAQADKASRDYEATKQRSVKYRSPSANDRQSAVNVDTNTIKPKASIESKGKKVAIDMDIQ